MHVNDSEENPDAWTLGDCYCTVPTSKVLFQTLCVRA